MTERFLTIDSRKLTVFRLSSALNDCKLSGEMGKAGPAGLSALNDFPEKSLTWL